MRARRCRVPYDVLFIPQLVTHLFVVFFALLLLLLVVVVVVVVLVVVLATHLIFAFLRAPKNRHIGCVFAFCFDTLGAKNTVHTDVFCASGPKPQYLRCFFFSSDSKSHGICKMFFGPRPAKTLAFTQFFCMLQEELFPCQRHENTVLQRFGSSQTQKNSKNPPKSAPKWTSKKHLVILSSFFSPPQTPQKVKTTPE